MNLHPKTIEALRWKAGVAADSIEENDPETASWGEVSEQCYEAADAGTTEVLRHSMKAKAELDNYLMGDMPKSERVAIQRDLCRAGHYEVHDPESVSTHRMKTLMVDGTLFEV